MIAQAASDAILVTMPVFVTVISTLCAVISAFAKYAYDRFKKCEDWRDAQEPKIQELMVRAGIAESTNDLVNECNVTGCPWKGKLENAYQLDPITKHRIRK